MLIEKQIEQPEYPVYFICDGDCGQYRSVRVVSVLEESGINFNGVCHHCLDYNGDLSRRTFKECLDVED